VPRHKPGRPRKRTQDRKQPIEVGVTPGEREILLAAAEAVGLSLSAFVRSAALVAARASG